MEYALLYPTGGSDIKGMNARYTMHDEGGNAYGRSAISQIRLEAAGNAALR